MHPCGVHTWQAEVFRWGAGTSHVCVCLQGTKLLFYDSKADVLLLDIPESIPDHFHAYKVGFDAAEEVPNRAVAIHHPAGNIKRISYANDSCAHPAPAACGWHHAAPALLRSHISPVLVRAE